MDEEETILKENTEMGEVFNNLDSDNKDDKTGMSTIDFNSRHMSEDKMNACTVLETMTRAGIFPPWLNLTHQYKRNTVSLKGLGREEKVRIASADREAKTGRTGMDTMKNWLGMGGQK